MHKLRSVQLFTMSYMVHEVHHDTSLSPFLSLSLSLFMVLGAGCLEMHGILLILARGQVFGNPAFVLGVSEAKIDSEDDISQSSADTADEATGWQLAIPVLPIAFR